MTRNEPPGLFSVGEAQVASPTTSSFPSPVDVARNFDPARLTQARQLAPMTKQKLAREIGVTAAAVGQYESGMRPRPDLLVAMATVLGYPVEFFMVGRPHAKLDASTAHFRSLRATRSYQRAKAVAFTEQVWELTYALEKRVQLPWVDLPGFSGGEIIPSEDLPTDPTLAAEAVRYRWNLGAGPIQHLVRTLEVHGIVVVLAPENSDFATVDAFSTSHLPRPIIVISRDRTADVYRHRFTVAHELGHLVLHGDANPGDPMQEREADQFAAQFLTPRASVFPQLPTRVNFGVFAELQSTWGVSISSLIYRCREVGRFSATTTSRAYQRLNALERDDAIVSEPISGYPGEQPTLLRSAFELATQHGASVTALATELAWPADRVRELIGASDERPKLELIIGGKASQPTYARRARKDPDDLDAPEQDSGRPSRTFRT
ncbi:MAG: XRE family transcriptional regulator [Catenulispora sp.]